MDFNILSLPQNDGVADKENANLKLSTEPR